ncbi:Conserved hypothetical, protein [Geosmithia morbida]|uniref:Conserved hypothetical, protein n=1 Tax=Geosmithia morbida TaxID=1094350 RepID=A0A9P5D5S4_9HYPO|nr:Conserved hypothetical, protein [Geosmithia morbida]KAF4124085.1 Conserved hypothetical, protein [Geosmithia morbida]
MNSQTTTTPKTTIARTSTIRSVPSNEGSDTSLASKNSVVSSSGQSSMAAAAAAAAATAEASTEEGDTMGAHHDNGDTTRAAEGDDHTEPPIAKTPPPRRNGPAAAGGVRVVEMSPVEPQEQDSPTDGGGNGDGADGRWDSTIGKAGLGKTGRVINKLVSDNDALKRDIKIERLRAEESKLAAKLVEDKMERIVSDYESRLLEASVTKTLLARKERQVESLQAALELEKNRAEAAIERERSWRRELERTQRDTTAQVEEATAHSQLMEGRYNAISSHWRSQGDEVNRAIAEHRQEIYTLVRERQDDDAKIQTLRDLCDQQDNNIKLILQEKEEIARKFAQYKQTQDDDLRHIRSNAAETEAEQQKLLDDAREALHKLRWALNVKQNVKGAQ